MTEAYQSIISFNRFVLRIDVVHRRFNHLFVVVRHFTLLKAVARKADSAVADVA